MYEFQKDVGPMVEKAIEIGTKYVNDNKIKALVLGMSGGIDSTLVAAMSDIIAKLADHEVEVVGYALSINSKQEETDRGLRAAAAFCSEHGLIDLTYIYRIIAQEIMGKDFISDDYDAKIRRGNLKARTRMLKLFDLARAKGGMVMSTDNLTELLLGFWTLHGDVGNYGLIQNFWKTEVYMAANYLALKYRDYNLMDKVNSLNACIAAIPTDGLGITNSDFDQILPVHDKSMMPEDLYRIVDEALMEIVYGTGIVDKKYEPILDRYRSTHFKRNDPYNIPREMLIK